MKKEQIVPIIIPVIADYVLSPTVIYGDDFTSINFETQDEKFGRITFENMDAIKICRGEMPAYHDPTEIDDYIIGTWVYFVENSKWLQERYQYEKKYYEKSYEWGNSVEEMLTDFKHYYFRFHDEFVEVIAKGFWFEKANEPFIGKPLTADHPKQLFQTEFKEEINSVDKKYKFKFNNQARQILEKNAQFYSQNLIEVWQELPNDHFLFGSLRIKSNNGKVVSYFQPTFGKAEDIKKGIATMEDLIKYLNEISLKGKICSKIKGSK